MKTLLPVTLAGILMLLQGCSLPAVADDLTSLPSLEGASATPGAVTEAAPVEAIVLGSHCADEATAQGCDVVSYQGSSIVRVWAMDEGRIGVLVQAYKPVWSRELAGKDEIRYVTDWGVVRTLVETDGLASTICVVGAHVSWIDAAGSHAADIPATDWANASAAPGTPACVGSGASTLLPPATGGTSTIAHGSTTTSASHGTSTNEPGSHLAGELAEHVIKHEVTHHHHHHH
jgi:hypothetical protein